MRKILIAVIRLYQIALSPWLGANCRFYPTCSSYAIQVIEKKGIIRGSWLIICRVGKCHPWHPGGYDPTPEDSDTSSEFGSSHPKT